MKRRPLIRPLYSRAKAFHYDPAWLEPRRRQEIERRQTPDELHLLELMEAAKAGYPDQLSAVIPMLHRNEDDSFWGRASLLLSYAAPTSVLHEFANSFADKILVEKDDIVQGFVAETLLNSCLLWSVPTALKIMRAQVNRTRMFSIPSRISSLLEAAPGEIFFGPEEIPEDKDLPDWFPQPVTYDDDSYERLVNAAYMQRLDEADGDSAIAVLLGAKIDVAAIVQDLIMSIGRAADDDILTRKRMIVEAQTGADLSAFYADNLVLDKMAAMVALEELYDKVDLDVFRPGKRYFFGRLLA